MAAMAKPQCKDCWYYEPTEDARQGLCLFNPPVPVPHPVQVAPNVALATGRAPQMAVGASGVVPPTPAHHRCHNFKVSTEKMN